MRKHLVKRPKPKSASKGSADPVDPVDVGAVAGVHGLKGMVRIKPFTEEPDGLEAYGPVWIAALGEYRQVTVSSLSKGVALCWIEGVSDRNAAEDLKGAVLTIDRSALPPPEEDEYYHADLVGLTLKDTEGQVIGTVRAVQNFGASDLLDVQPQLGTTGSGGARSSILVPFTTEIVPTVDLAAGEALVDVGFIASLLEPVSSEKGLHDGAENGTEGEDG